jgi:hypothetical protein
MSEHQPQRSSTSEKEKRREKVAEAKDDETLADDQIKRIARKHLPWSDWIMGEFMQYWYWLLVLAMDVFVIMDLAQRYHVRDSLGLLVIVGVFIGFVVAEYLVFIKLWPESAVFKDRWGR